MRPFRLSLTLAVVTALALALFGGSAKAATPASVTLDDSNSSASFTGTLLISNFLPDCPPAATGDLVCEHVAVTLGVSGTATVCVGFPAGPSALNDVDVFVYNSLGIEVGTPGVSSDNPECATFHGAAGSTFEVRINPVFVDLGPIDVSGTVSLTADSPPTGGNGGGGIGPVVDPPISIGNTSVPEGNVGATNAYFKVWMDSPTTAPVTVNYATVDNRATAPTDYLPTTGSVIFQPGETVKTISVPVVGNTLLQPDRDFRVRLSLPTPPYVAVIKDGEGVGWIRDDDSRRIAKGGGTINGSTAKGTLSLRVSENGSGKLTYAEGSAFRFRTTSIASVSFDDLTHTVQFQGTGLNNGSSVGFVATVKDNGPLLADTFSLALDTGARAAGELTSGNIAYATS
jgi:hypothetical protein